MDDFECRNGNCPYQNWKPFDFNFEPQNLWSNLVFYILNLLALLILFAMSNKINSNDYMKSFVILSIYTPACLMVFALFFDVNRLVNGFYFHHILMDVIMKVFNGITKTVLVLNSAMLLMLAIYVAHTRKSISGTAVWGPFCAVLVFAIIWFFFFGNRLHQYFLVANVVLVGIGLLTIMFCSSFRFGAEVDPIIADARSRLFYSCLFVTLFLSYYAWVEVFYNPKAGDYYDVLRGCQFIFFALLIMILFRPYRSRQRVQPPVVENPDGYMRQTEISIPPSAPPETPISGCTSQAPIYPSAPVIPHHYYPPQPYPMFVPSTTVVRHFSTPNLHAGMYIHQSPSYPQMHQGATGGYYFVR